MDVILDTNIYLGDIRMGGNQFQELFAYLRRTGSRLILPKLVVFELLQRYRDQLTKVVNGAAGAWTKVREKAVSDPGELLTPDIEQQVCILKDNLRRPPRNVQIVPYDDYTGVDVHELVKRGVNRIRPASANGEELRDVILWMIVLQYAKKRGTEVAFLSHDKTFTDTEGKALHEQLASDVQAAGVKISFYRDIGSFIAANSLDVEAITEEWLNSLLKRDSVEDEAKRSLLNAEVGWGRVVKSVEVDTVHLASGKRYLVGENSFYAEMLFSGTARITVEQSPLVNVSYSIAQPIYTDAKIINTLNLTDWYNPSGISFALPAGATAAPVISSPVFEPQWRTYKSEARPVEGLYRCQFEMELSLRTDKGALISLQTDRLEIKSMDSVPNLAPS